MINNIQAIEQPLDFEDLKIFFNSASDVDGLLELNNGQLVVLEIKKDTPNHSYENIQNKSQFRLLQKLIGNRSDIIFIYATHNQPIDINIPIHLPSCEVKHIEIGGKEQEVIPEIKSLDNCIKYYSRFIYDPLNLYLMVRYPNGKLEYCVVSPKYKKWSTSNYNEEEHRFENYKEVDKYVEARYIQGYNQNNEYWLFKKENGSDILIKQYRYKEEV